MAHIRQITNLLPQPVRFGLRRVAFAGSDVTCPLCEARLRGYRAHGGGHEVLERRQVVGGARREDDRCPVCHGKDRTRMVMHYIATETGLGTRPLRVLHVAPDYGLYLWLKRQPQVEQVSTDIDASRYRHIEGIRSADLTGTPFEADSFDVIVCSHVLEHIPDDAAAFAELRRILKPGGHALLLTPFALDGAGTEEEPSISDPAEQERRFGQWDHVRLYDREDFLDRMRKAGFEARLHDPFQADPARAEELHLNPQELLPVGTKPASA